MTESEETREERVEGAEEEGKMADGGEERVDEADVRAQSRCGGVTAAGADTGSQRASRSGLMSKGTGVTGSRPAELHLFKQEGTAGAGGGGGGRDGAERRF